MSATAPPKLLLVDDLPANLLALESILEDQGYELVQVTSGAAAIAAVEQYDFAVILLDVNMPDMSGPQLHERLRELGMTIPVIYLTGKGSVPLSVQAMKRGALDFLEKPIDEDLLLAAIDAAVEQHRAHAAQEHRIADWKARLARLSAREREVMEHVIAGRLNKQIAADLGIAEKTVKVHRGRVMTKAGVRSLAQLVHLCDELGLGGTVKKSGEGPEEEQFA
jgi:FixJ family two-component response regulator